MIFEAKGRRANAPPRSRAGRIRSVFERVALKGQVSRRVWPDRSHRKETNVRWKNPALTRTIKDECYRNEPGFSALEPARAQGDPE
jgi:hypothetical protein